MSETTIEHPDDSLVASHPDGGIVCEVHGRDPVRDWCVVCEIMYDRREDE
jgi:hypothetical protein